MPKKTPSSVCLLFLTHDRVRGAQEIEPALELGDLSGRGGFHDFARPRDVRVVVLLQEIGLRFVFHRAEQRKRSAFRAHDGDSVQQGMQAFLGLGRCGGGRSE